MENVSFFSEHSEAMKAASSDDSAMTSFFNSLLCLNFEHCHSKKPVSKGRNVREISRSFC